MQVFSSTIRDIGIISWQRLVRLVEDYDEQGS